jgi:outer membrane protein OmpA-like peptidoglycan-associated protein
MFRCRSGVLRRAWTPVLTIAVAVATVAAAPERAAAQQSSPSDTSQRVLDLRFTILDLDYTLATLDGAVSDTTSPTKVTITLSADVFFAFDRSDLSAKGKRELRAVTGRLEGAKEPVRIDGYTDSVGTDAYNKRLSLQRAETVRSALADAGITLRMTASGHGEANPVAPNEKPDGDDNPKGRAKNRRVTIAYRR